MSNKAFFVGDHAALDFLNTIAAPRDEEIEFIPDGESFLTWQVDAGLLDISAINGLMDKFGKLSLNRVAGEARELREWFRQALQEAVRAPAGKLAKDMIATLNQILANDSAYRQLQGSAGQVVLREIRKITKAQQLLIPIAQKMAELLTTTDRSLIKRCANPSCTLWFYDQTKAHRRLFCSPSVCGNRAKVAAFRKRQSKSN